MFRVSDNAGRRTFLYLLQWVGIGNRCSQTNNASKCIQKRRRMIFFLCLNRGPVDLKIEGNWCLLLINGLARCWASYRLNFTSPSHKFSHPSTGRHATTLISRPLTRSTHWMPFNLANYHLFWIIIHATALLLMCDPWTRKPMAVGGHTFIVTKSVVLTHISWRGGEYPRDIVGLLPAEFVQ